MLPAFLTTIFFSLSAICGNRSTRLIGGVSANFWRLSVAAVLLSIWAFTGGQGLGGAAVRVFLLSGFIGIGLGDVAFFQTLPRLGPKLTVMIVQCLAAPFGALFEWLWLGTRLTSNQILFGLIILAGIAASLAPAKNSQIQKDQLFQGTLFGLLAASGTAAGAVISRHAYAISEQHHSHIDGGTAAFQRIFGGLSLAAIFFGINKWRSRDSLQSGSRGNETLEMEKSKWQRAVPWILANGLLGQTCGVSCYQWALNNYPTGVVLPIVATTPLMAIPFTYFIDGERPEVRSIVGGVIAVVGVVGLKLVK